jgi:hypothetical protein
MPSKIPGGSPRFDLRKMRTHSHLLERAGRDLEDAYQSVSVIGTIAALVRTNDLAKAFQEDVLDVHQEDALMNAIVILADTVSDALDNSAEWFGHQLEQAEGGA